MRWNACELTGWGRALRAEADVARPERVASLHAILAEEPGPAIGARRSYGDACLNAGGRMVDLSRLDRMLAFDPAAGRITVEAGVRLADLLAVLAPQGWRPTVMTGSGQVTVGGAIANDVHGKGHHQEGSFAGSVTAFTLLMADGRAERVTQGTPLFAATAGGLGQTGVIERAELRLAPCPGQAVRVRERRIPDLAAFLAAFEASDAPFSVGWVDATATGAALGRGILEEAEITDAAPPRARPARRVPMDAPGVLLSGPVVRAFNHAYFHRIPAAGRSVIRRLDDFFSPLDRIQDWNRLYGRRGFHQFQCVLPNGSAAQGLAAMLEAISKAGRASPLAVLKRLGAGRAGHLSFPMPGMTLAVDMANGPEARTLIGRLNAMTADLGGRVYFAKDSLLDPGLVAAMVPELPEWQATVAAADPGRVFETDLTRRLGLRGAR